MKIRCKQAELKRPVVICLTTVLMSVAALIALMTKVMVPCQYLQTVRLSAERDFHRYSPNFIAKCKLNGISDGLNIINLWVIFSQMFHCLTFFDVRITGYMIPTHICLHDC